MNWLKVRYLTIRWFTHGGMPKLRIELRWFTHGGGMPKLRIELRQAALQATALPIKLLRLKNK